jgi:hypothetical protein
LKGVYLIFAPTDYSFEASPDEQVNTIMADPDALSDFDRSHSLVDESPRGFGYRRSKVLIF